MYVVNVCFGRNKLILYEYNAFYSISCDCINCISIANAYCEFDFSKVVMVVNFEEYYTNRHKIKGHLSFKSRVYLDSFYSYS